MVQQWDHLLGPAQPNALLCQVEILVIDGGPAEFEPIEYNC